MNRAYGAVVAAMLLVLGLPEVGLAGGPVPIKGDLVADVTTLGYDPTTGILHNSAEASGIVSHLGKTSAALDFTIFLGASDLPFEGTITFTAANGDELNASFTGYYVSPTDFVGQIIFTGGTGRFANATGTAVLTGDDIDGNVDHFEFSFQGEIQY